MSNALQELKTLLLSKSIRTFDTMDQGSSIVSALQSLLKVAEMRNKCCFFDDCAHPTLARQHKFSLNISLDNDRLLVPTDDQCVLNGAYSSDFYGHSDGDSTETDNSYNTADEGYDGDAELAKFADTDFDSDWSQSTTVSAPAFRAYVVHEGICRIVTDTLIDLSKRCLANPEFCISNLMQIVTRLYPIRNLLGGPLYLIRGFTSILESNDGRLRDFQKSILDLITDLNTPDALSAYFALMTSENPPLDLLLNRLIYLGSHDQCNQPSIEVEFPVFSDIEIKHNCGTSSFDNVRKLCANHEQQKIESPLTQSAFVAPINKISFKPWTKDGFTITTWVRLNADGLQTSDSGPDSGNAANEDEGISDSESQNCVCKNKLHFLSIGTNSMLLSIYLCATHANTFLLQLSNPNVQAHRGISKSHSEHFRCIETAQANGQKKSKCLCTGSRKRRVQKREHSQQRNATKAKENAPENVKSNENDENSIASNVLNSTRLALKSSLSHFNLFSTNRSSDKDIDANFGSPVFLRGMKLHKNRWSLLSISAAYSGNEVQLSISIDNASFSNVSLPCSQVHVDAKREKCALLTIGHRHSPAATFQSRTAEDAVDGSNDNEAKTKSLKYSLANVLLFKTCKMNREIVGNLYALGPDCVNFAQCQIGNIIPNLGIPATAKMSTTMSTNEVLRELRESILLVYSAHQPNLIIGYQTIDEGISSELIRFCVDLQPKCVPSFNTALLLSGGLTPLLFLFARVVELSTSDMLQSSALQFLLKIAHSNSFLFTEFVRQNYISLLGPVIRSSQCLKTIRLLNSVLETACSGPVITKGAEGFELSTTSNVCVVYADLIVNVINHYSDWHCANTLDGCSLIEMLLNVIHSLVSEKHAFQSLNIARLNKAKLVPALFNFCKIHLTSNALQIHWTQSAAEALVNVIRIFAGAPPVPALLDDIIKVLLMLHRPSNSYVTHDRSKFYFQLSSTSQQKGKRMGLQLSGRKLSLGMRKSPSNSQSNLQRSTSLDQSINKNGSLSHSRRANNKKGNSSEETIMEMMPLKANTQPNTSNCSSSADEASPRDSQRRIDRKLGMILNASDRAKFERALAQLNAKRQPSKNKRLRKNRKNKYQRQRSITESDASDRDKKSIRRRKRSVSDSGIDLTLFREYEIIADDEIKRINVSDKDDKSETTVLSFELSHSVVHIQNGLLDLLRDFILILPDTAIDEVLSHYVTIDIVLVLANNETANVRASIVRLLAAMCERLATIAKSIHFFQLGNQIALYPAEHSLVQSCVHWITGSTQNFDQMHSLRRVKIAQKNGLSALMAIAPQTIHDIAMAKSVFQLLTLFYNSADDDTCSYMIEFGLVPAVVKSLARVYVKWGSENDKLIIGIEQLMCHIALRALSTAGSINILWDLLNCITHIEQNKNGTICRGIRSTQATILLSLVKSFFRNRYPITWSYKATINDINLSDSSLSISEKRTRLELLLDRAIHFIRTANVTHTLTPQEIQLIEALATLSMSGFTRGSIIIPWCFLPNNPMPLKLFIAKLIWKHTKNADLPTVCCDPKLVKTMIHSFWSTDRDVIPPNDYDILENVCTSLGIHTSGNINAEVTQAIAKMELARENILKERKPSIERSVYKFESIASNCIDSAMKITRYVVEMQNSERRNAIAHIRIHDDCDLAHEWNMIVDRMTHEGAPWYSQRNYSNSWELDPTEGPSRMRIRMKRCQLEIPSRFFLPENEAGNERRRIQLPLKYLKDALHQRRFAVDEQILYTFPCKLLQIDQEVIGELIVTEANMLFVTNETATNASFSISTIAITDVWLRRYQHNDNAMEFFLETNTSIFIILQSSNDRELLKVYFSDKILQSPDAKLTVITQQWREGQITNWEYLIALNLISGRTYQDLMQYPVFPWILSDYESQTLDLNGSENYRNLAKPIAIQHSTNEEHYVNSYNYLNSLYNSIDSHQLAPYHYGSHYSNSGTVLHFLVRVPPFTRYFLHYQDNNFDLPDRTFHSVLTTWRLASRDSTTDVKELISEFFSFPEFLENNERFDFGIRQSGEVVDHVKLPPWCRDSARLFILIHRQALESEVTRRNLHNWIDLVFGFRQTGQAAIDAINVFHPATYYGFSSSEIVDSVERSAMETMVKTYGQMPRTLFKAAHPQSQATTSSTAKVCSPILKNIKGLRWGQYTGSPELGEPRVCCLYQQFDVKLMHLMALPNTNVVYAFSDGHNVMQGSEPDTMNIIQWKQIDGVVRIKPLRDVENFDQKPLTYNHHIDEITICGTDPNFNQLWFGHASGRITVYQCKHIPTQSKYKNFHLTSFNKFSHNSALRKISMKFSHFHSDNETENGNGNSADTLKWNDPVILVRHTNAVTGIHVSKEFKIVVTVANDGFAVIWDANSLQFVRSIARPTICRSPISLLTVSSTLGDIVTVHDLSRDGHVPVEEDRFSECYEATENIDDFVNVAVDVTGKSLLRVHTINAKYVSHITVPEKILCVCYSYVKEGIGVNVIAAGLENGLVRLWSSWDLSLVREFMVSSYDVLGITYSTYQHLIVLTSDNIIQVWDAQTLHGNPPKFPQVVFQKRNSI